MDELNRRRPGLHVALGAVLLTLAACLLLSCTQEMSDHRTRQGRAATGSMTGSGNAGRSASPAPQSRPDKVLGRLPVPEASDAPALARRLELAAATLRDREAPAGDVRRAGEFQQLAVGTLATAPDTFRQRVTGRLSPQTAVVVRGAVRAASLLHAMTSPQRRLPRWRIVAAPPA